VLPAFVLTVGVRDFDLKANIVRVGLNYQCPYHKKNFQIRKIENAAAAKTVYHMRVTRPALLSAARAAMLSMMIKAADATRSHSVLMAIAASAVP